MVDIKDLLKAMIAKKASDLHLHSGSPPCFRVDGQLLPLDLPPFSPEEVENIVTSLAGKKRMEEFEANQELDFSFGISGLARFRSNVCKQRGTMAAFFRAIPMEVKSIDELGLPSICKSLVLKQRGLILVTGPTGSGKSTTLASLIDHINAKRRCHIVTLEDPIEFLFKDKKSVITQREVGEDTHSFSAALKRVLRQDPDVIMVGEMRDLETISAAITAAETGHLVLTTLHTTGAAASIDRIIDVFPSHQQTQVRVQLAMTLEAVISQLLLPRIGSGRVLALEVMVAMPAVRNLIREGKTHQLETILETGSKHGMISLNAYLKHLCDKGLISRDLAALTASSREEFLRLCQPVTP